MESGALLLWLHELAMAAYFGAQFAMLYMLLPVAEQAGDEDRRRAALITGFKFYNPFTIAVLGVVVVTGAMKLTDVKAEMKFQYFSRIWPALSFKLLLAFLLIFIQTYITFGLAFRIGRQEEVAAHGDGPRFTVEQIDSMLRRIRAMTWVTIVLTAAIIFVSLTSMRRAVSESAGASADAAPAAAFLSAGTGARARRRLQQGGQRSDDPGDGQESEHQARKFVEQCVLCVVERLARARQLDIRQTRNPRLIDSRFHSTVLLVNVWTAIEAMSMPSESSRFSNFAAPTGNLTRRGENSLSSWFNNVFNGAGALRVL
jgi:uncharacterized membrane protein